MTACDCDSRPEIERYFWRNYLAHTIEGGLYMGGMMFVNAVTVLTFLVKSMQGPDLLVAMVPMLMPIGFMAPSLFVAHRIERMYWLKPFIMLTGVFQRVPYLIAGLALIFWSGRWPRLVVYIVAFTPLFSSLPGGFSSTAWLTLVSKTIPSNRLCSTWAIRQIIQNTIGLFAGTLIWGILERYSGPEGYGILHLIAFGFLVLSYAVFAMIKETDDPPPDRKNQIGLIENLKQIPGLIQRDHALRSFIISQVMVSAMQLMIPFLSTHALYVLCAPPRYLGLLVGFQSAGAICGNIAAGIIGDRIGPRVLLVASRFLFTAMAIWCVYADTLAEFCGIYLLFGLGLAMGYVGGPSFRIALAPAEKKQTYLAIMGFINLPSLLVASFGSVWAWQLTQSVVPAASIAATGVMISLIFFLRIKLPPQ